MMSIPELNIYQKISKIRHNVEILQKNKKGYGYTYVSDDEILAKITGMMDKLGLSLYPRVVPATTIVTPYSYTKTKVLKDGKIIEEQNSEILVQADTEYMWINDENPEERIVIPWTLVGQQSDVSQAFGAGMTYTRRYFLLHFFNSATSDDDPDNWRSKQKDAVNAQQREVAKAIVDQVHTMVSTYIQSHEEDREKITMIVKKYAREKGRPSSNYFNIDDPKIASDLLEELKPVCGATTNEE